VIILNGQEVLLINGHFSDEVWVVDHGALVSVIDLPQSIRTSDGTARRFVEREASKRGLVAVPQDGYVFKIRRKRIYVFLHWLERGLLYVPRW
jgi:hypothetical protein